MARTQGWNLSYMVCLVAACMATTDYGLVSTATDYMVVRARCGSAQVSGLTEQPGLGGGGAPWCRVLLPRAGGRQSRMLDHSPAQPRPVELTTGLRTLPGEGPY